MRYLIIFLLFQFFSCSNPGQREPLSEVSSDKFKVEEVYKGKGVLWGFDFLDESRVLLSHRNGNLFLYNLKDKSKKRIDAPAVHAKGQGGLLDVHFKKIKDKEFIYLTFSEKLSGNKAVTSLARGEFKEGGVEKFEVIFRSNADGDGTVHYGSRLVFDGESLYMTIGERGERELAQDIKRHNGSILRLTLEGKPHPENPFIGKEGLDEIFSYGHRNSQGIDFDPVSKKLYSAEMGPRGGDELNLIVKGANYGWPKTTYGKEYYGPQIGKTKMEGMKKPLIHWTPSISPSGMVFYTGEKIREWKNHLFLVNLSGQHIRKLVLQDGEVKNQVSLFGDMGERFRHVRNSPDGFLYFSTDSGRLFKVSSKK